MNSRVKHPDASSAEGLLLPGLDGANPLGFLATLGVLRTLSSAKSSPWVAVSWEQMSGSWAPRLFGIDPCVESLARAIAENLHVPFTSDANAEEERESAQKEFDEQRKRLKDARETLKKRKLRGAERQQAEREDIDPIRNDVIVARSKWLEALKTSVPSEELSLGKHLNATRDELREAMQSALQGATISHRETTDLYAAFGSDACATDKGQMQATPFCFTTGSGHQYFLDTARQLFGVVSSDRIKAAIAERGESSDEKLSLRWDPVEDRRYAVMWSDPTASDNKATTNWARNLLSYRGLQFFTCVPGKSGRLNSTGWSVGNASWTWPVWTMRLKEPVIRSLLTCPPLSRPEDSAEELRALGIAAVYRCQRIQVGNPPLHKINFGPARQIG